MSKLVFFILFLSLFFFPAVVLAVTPTSTTFLPPFGGIYNRIGFDPQTGNTAKACLSTTGNELTQCLDCVNNQKGNWTIFGCLPSDPNGFAASLLRFSLGIGGGVAFLATLLGGFYLLTSEGDPERINLGKKIIFYSLTGLIVIIFAVFILQFLGLNLLGIPEFGK